MVFCAKRLVQFGLCGIPLYFACISKIITSPEKISLVRFGEEPVEKTWDNVDKLTLNSTLGSIHLVFKEPVHRKRAGNFLDISFYIDDYDTVNLLEDIAKYAPQNNISEFVKKYNRKVKTYQKGESIALYYLGLVKE